MICPPLVVYLTPQEYKNHYIDVYCRNGPIKTFDGIDVYFYNDQFEHAFFESSNFKGNKDIFSLNRAQRIDWIKAVLYDPTAELYVGHDSQTKAYSNDRRVAIINDDDYVVIIRTAGIRAKFITAYLADSPRTALQIRSNPKWTK